MIVPAEEDEEATVAPKVVAPSKGEGEYRSDSEESSCSNDNVSSPTASSPSPTPVPYIISRDAAVWPRPITDNTRQIIVEQGPNQVKDLGFPQHGGRRFPVSSYVRRLRNGEEVHRERLVYSVSKNSVFLFLLQAF
nr:PREDICTED: zinc finger MYM-type protein 5-like [Latimeria chalumnae]|eukprot:XP_014351192.1 PREDICTED: zinc finger MYM-type protein 5-like [Latimeria chalumnae]